MSDFCGPRKSSCNSPLVDTWTTGVHLFQCMTYKCSRFMTVARGHASLETSGIKARH